MKKCLIFAVVFLVGVVFGLNAYAQSSEDRRKIVMKERVQKEVVIRIPVKDGHFDFEKASVDGGEVVTPPYDVKVNEMFSIPLQIGSGSWHAVYIHLPDCRYIKVWVP